MRWTQGRHRPTKTEPQTYEMPLVQTWETCRTWYQPPTTWQRLKLWIHG